MAKFKNGDRVKGLYAHRGKTGTVVESGQGNHLYVCIKWDGGKRKAWVDSAKLKLLENGQQ